MRPARSLAGGGWALSGEEGAELAHRFNEALERFWGRQQYSRYGGAPLLGANGINEATRTRFLSFRG